MRPSPHHSHFGISVLDSGLKRSGKSCRLRWVNYLRPDLKRCKITPQEESVIVQLHALWGNRYSKFTQLLFIMKANKVDRTNLMH